jgi:hypothetical protein
MRYGLALILAFVTAPAAALLAQESPANRPTAATQPAADAAAAPGEPMQARVVKLTGQVQYARTDAQGNAGEWQEAKLNDLLPAGTRIRTRLRSKVVLAFGDDSVVLIDRATLASIEQFHRVADTKHVRLGLGHGAVRAGVAETTLRSDMTIETPTATLSKRGTIGFGIEYEPSTGRFRVFLADEGLVNALNKLTGESRDLYPGQYVTQEMIRWIETAVFDRHVALADLFGPDEAEKLFNALHSSGIGVVEPGGGMTTFNVAPLQRANFAPGGELLLGAGAIPAVLVPLLGIRSPDRPEGNFGTGNGRFPSR